MAEPDREQTRRSLDAIWRIESARVVSTLMRHVGDLALAEDLAQEALVAALQQWPESGVPRNPGAWLLAVAKRRFVDLLRRRSILDRKLPLVAADTSDADALDDDVANDELPDDVLRLMFVACHPVIAAEARVALTLKVVAGLSVAEIARAFVVKEATVSQRLVRAKRTLGEARVPFELPNASEQPQRLESVLQAIYLIFNEGYTATTGISWLRTELCQEALRLGRSLASLLPAEPEVHGLVALMEFQASRLRARVGELGEAILLGDQDRARWDRLLIGRGVASLERAGNLNKGLGYYGIQAAIASCHAQARCLEDTDWLRVSALYDALAQMAPSPIVELNRAVALSMVYGPETGLQVVDGLRSQQELDGYHLLHSVRADLLEKLGFTEEACRELQVAASLTANKAEQRLLLDRANKARKLSRP